MSRPPAIPVEHTQLFEHFFGFFVVNQTELKSLYKDKWVVYSKGQSLIGAFLDHTAAINHLTIACAAGLYLLYRDDDELIDIVNIVN